MLAAGLALPLLWAALPAAAAMNAYIKLTVNGNVLQCESTAPRYENHAEAIAVATDLFQPVSGGRPSGARQHSPIRITKLLDRCTPLLANALVQGQVVDAIIRFVHIDPQGMLENHFTIETRNGRIIGQSLVLPDTLDSSTSGLPMLEHVSLTFESITWRHEIGGTEAMDNLQQMP